MENHHAMKMGKSTISMAIFNSSVTNHQRVFHEFLKNVALKYEAQMHPSAPNISLTQPGWDQAQLQAAREKQVIKVRKKVLNGAWIMCRIPSGQSK